MAEYIDRTKLLPKIKYREKAYFRSSINMFSKVVKEMPAATVGLKWTERKKKMRKDITTTICTTLLIIAVLAFVFGLVYISGNYNFLWFLFLVLTYTFITRKNDGKDNKEDKYDKR